MWKTLVGRFLLFGSIALNVVNAVDVGQLTKMKLQWFDGFYRQPSAQERDEMLKVTNDWFEDIARAQYPNLVQLNLIAVADELDLDNALSYEFGIDTTFDESFGRAPTGLEVFQVVSADMTGYILHGLFANLPMESTFQNIQQAHWESLPNNDTDYVDIDGGNITDTESQPVDALRRMSLAKMTWQWFDGFYRQPSAQELGDMLLRTEDWFGDIARDKYSNILQWNMIPIASKIDQNNVLSYEFEINAVFDETGGAVPTGEEDFEAIFLNVGLTDYILDALYANLPDESTFQLIQQVRMESLTAPDTDANVDFDAASITENDDTSDASADNDDADGDTNANAESQLVDAVSPMPLAKITWQWFDGFYRQPSAKELDDMLEVTEDWFGDVARDQYPNLVQWNLVPLTSEIDQNNVLSSEFEINVVFDLDGGSTVPNGLDVFEAAFLNIDLTDYIYDALYANLPRDSTFQAIQQVALEILNATKDTDTEP